VVSKPNEGKMEAELPDQHIDDVEGIDSPESEGWGDYPLDSVFVRTDARTVRDVVMRINNSRYDLSPDFQREYLWDVGKQSRLIESCVMRIPLPVFYVAEAKDGRIIVVDGLQRLTTFKRYLNNEFKLKLPKPEKEGASDNLLHGKRFDQLPLNLQERIEDTQLTLYILDAKAPERAKLDIFDRVNSGVMLTRQQMRNSLYNGPATKWLQSVATSDVFLNATGRSLNPKTMRDREAINRFCAFQIKGWQSYKSADMDGFLADALERMNKMDDSQREDLRERFELSMRNNTVLFGAHAFRKSLVQGDGDRFVLNIALFDVCSVYFAGIPEGQVNDNADLYRSAIRLLITDHAFDHAITYSTNSVVQIRKRFEMMNAAMGVLVP
jgi:hypothetical protein